MREKHLEDLKEIKDIMNRSTRFISLSGLSGVSTGIIALAGAWFAWQLVFKGEDYLVYEPVELSGESIRSLLFIAIGTLILSISAAIFFTSVNTKKRNQKPWDLQSRRLLINLSIPLVAGGLLCLALLFNGLIGLLPSLTLVFYGLALVNGSKYTFSEIRTLGLIQVLLGLAAIQFIDYGLLLWAFGFGIVQMVYGIIIQRKYQS